MTMPAETWLKRNRKAPMEVNREGYDNGEFAGMWRWVLPDPPTKESTFDLPKDIFDRLKGGNRRFPWIFKSREDAIKSAVSACKDAVDDGWKPTIRSAQ